MGRPRIGDWAVLYGLRRRRLHTGFLHSPGGGFHVIFERHLIFGQRIGGAAGGIHLGYAYRSGWSLYRLADLFGRTGGVFVQLIVLALDAVDVPFHVVTQLATRFIRRFFWVGL